MISRKKRLAALDASPDEIETLLNLSTTAFRKKTGELVILKKYGVQRSVYERRVNHISNLRLSTEERKRLYSMPKAEFEAEVKTIRKNLRKKIY